MLTGAGDNRGVGDTRPLSKSDGFSNYLAIIKYRVLIVCLLLVALFVSFSVDLCVGPTNIGINDVINALFMPETTDYKTVAVIWQIRMPMAVMALVVGAMLSVAGPQMQTILNNPLASPFTLGISAAASFGAALALSLGIAILPAATEVVVPLNAFIVAMLTAVLIHFLSMMRGVSIQTVLLLGIALVFTFNALLSLVQFISSAEALSAVVFWTMGSLLKATWDKIIISSFILLVIFPLFIYRSWELTAMRLGDERAESLGIKIGRLRLETLLLVSLIAAVPISFVGTIGFIGLVAPHVARLLIGDDQRFFLFASLLCGSLMLSLGSIASKVLLSGAIIPIGIVTSLVGIPFFMFLIFSTKKQLW